MKYQGTKRMQNAFVSPMGSFVRKPKNQTVGAGVGVNREQVGIQSSNAAPSPTTASSPGMKTYADFFLAVQSDYPGRIPVWQGIYPDELYEGDYFGAVSSSNNDSLNTAISNNAAMIEEARQSVEKSGNRRRRWAATALGETPKRDGPFASQARSIMQKNPTKAITLRSSKSRKLPFGIDPWGFKTPQSQKLSGPRTKKPR